VSTSNYQSDIRTPSSSGRGQRCLVNLPHASFDTVTAAVSSNLPGLYILNINSLAKPHVIDQRSADIVSYDTDIVIITETHLKERHSTSIIRIHGYIIIRRDRLKRCRGGVAVITKVDYPVSELVMDIDAREHELL